MRVFVTAVCLKTIPAASALERFFQGSHKKALSRNLSPFGSTS